MRIITGSAKGRHLKSNAHQRLRPTSDRVKESLFSILGEFVNNARVLDLYAGTGNLGLEALSRGAQSAVFIEKAHSAISILHENVETLGFREVCEVWKADVLTAIPKLAARQLRFELIFADPPYHSDALDKAASLLINHRLLALEGILIIEKHLKHELKLRDIPITCFRENRYGDTLIQFYQWKKEPSNGV